MSREWPLWESSSERYSLTAEDRNLSQRFATGLRAWHARWLARGKTDPVPDQWIDEGHLLHARLQSELELVAEVRVDFDK